jgi:hypothetical protein
MSKHVEAGAKVRARINGQQVDALVIRSAFSAEGDYDLCQLKIAVRSPLTGQVLTSLYPHLIQSYKLTRRYTVCDALDQEVSA